MFGVDSSELLLIVLIAVVVIGPKDLPRVMRSVGQWVGKARSMAGQFRLGVDQMMRDSEIAELEKKWREQNEAIMRAHPMASTDPLKDETVAHVFDKEAPVPAAPRHRPAPEPPVSSGLSQAPTLPREVDASTAVASAPTPDTQAHWTTDIIPAAPPSLDKAPPSAEPAAPPVRGSGRRAPRTKPGP